MSTSHPPNAAVARVLELQAQDPELYGTQMKLAEATGLDQKSWSNYMSGKTTPSRLAREEIRRKLKIAVNLWDVPCDVHRNDPKDNDRTTQVPYDGNTTAKVETPTAIALDVAPSPTLPAVAS